MSPPAKSPTPTPAPAPVARRDLVIAAACGAFVAAMVGMSYAAVPLYSWFCRTTGFGGTPLVAHAAPAQISDRQITVFKSLGIALEDVAFAELAYHRAVAAGVGKSF